MGLARAVEPEHCPVSVIDWIQLMQHHGVPTPLLDWTTAPLVALFFAVQNHRDDIERQPVVWCLKSEEIKGFYSSTCEDEQVLAMLMREPGRMKAIQRLIPTNPNRRVAAQQGCFTVHPPPHPNVVGDLPECQAIDIHPACKSRLYKSLQFMGITEVALFPGLDAAADYLVATRKFAD